MPLTSWLVCLLAALWARPAVESPTESRVVSSLTVKHRQIAQRNGRWQVRYQLEYRGSEPLDLGASDVSLDYDGWVSNSRTRAHAVPKRSQIHYSPVEIGPAVSTVIAHANEKERCRERVTLAVSVGSEPLDEAIIAKRDFVPMRVAPGDTIWLYLTLDHEHFLHGSYDPLLGERRVEFQLGSCRVTDTLPLDQEHTTAAPRVRLSTPNKERLDARQSRTGRDSLYLAADVPGYQYFRFDDMPVRYGSSFRLSFWYLVAVGTEGGCQVRLMEYQDTPSAWYRLEGGFDEALPTQGRWEKFEHTFKTLADSTTMAIDFRITGTNVGEMWIDDVKLEPVAPEVATRRIDIVRRRDVEKLAETATPAKR